MNESTTQDRDGTERDSKVDTDEVRRTSFLGRLVRKLDDSMKRKADQRAGEGCCGSDDKGGKCC